MEGFYKVEIVAHDPEGDEIILFRNSKLSYEAFVGVEEAIALGLVGMGKIAVEAKKQK
jgi:hypothetical protein